LYFHVLNLDSSEQASARYNSPRQKTSRFSAARGGEPEERIELVSGNQPSKGLESTDRAFDDPSLAVAPQRATVLRGVADAALAMRADQLDVATSKTLPQGIAICRAVVDQPAGNVGRDSLIQERLDESHFRGARAIDVDHHRPHGSLGYVTPVEFAA